MKRSKTNQISLELKPCFYSIRHIGFLRFFACLFFLFLGQGCNKLVEIPQPINTITDTKVFNNDTEANSAIAAIYSDMSVGNPAFTLKYANGATSIYIGLYGDELKTSSLTGTQFQNNTLVSTDATVSGSFWNPAYYDIYQANAAIEGIQASTGISAASKKELTGEAKFIRAFCHFYLVNLFGDVPLITQSAWASVNTLPRTPSALVYQQIIQDLKDAQTLLNNDYSIAGGEHIRANVWAATALLARVYLYTGDWADAESQATAVIGSNQYSLLTNLDNVFLKNSAEAILQWQTASSNLFATVEGNQIIPTSHTASPSFTLSTQLYAAFQAGDQRRKHWVDSTIFQKKIYYYPAKYKSKKGTVGNITEYYMALRFAEQYLIRAEARAQQNTNLSGAIADLNVIRTRAGLTPLSSSLLQSQVLTAIAQERRIELFAEWSHRWFDLKRTGQTITALSAAGKNITSNALLLPIPVTELVRDPNLTQNAGY